MSNRSSVALLRAVASIVDLGQYPALREHESALRRIHEQLQDPALEAGGESELRTLLELHPEIIDEMALAVIRATIQYADRALDSLSDSIRRGQWTHEDERFANDVLRPVLESLDGLVKEMKGKG